MQALEVHGAGQHGEGRVVECLVGFCVTPALDGEVGDGGAVLGANGGEECVHGCRVFDGEGVAGVEDWLGFGVNGPVETKDVGHKGWQGNGICRGS